MRIDTDLGEEDRKRVQEYARKKGLRLSRAYTELIRIGLEVLDGFKWKNNN